MPDRPPTRAGAPRAVAAGLVLALATGCGSVPPPGETAEDAPSRLPGSPTYDARREPAAAVLPLVPAAATRLMVTDLDEIRTQLGVPGQDAGDPAEDREAFWRRAAVEAPVLDASLLRPEAATTLPPGVTRDDVAWRAEFSGGGASGWVLALHPGVDLPAVGRSLAGAGGALGDVRVLPADRLVVSGVAPDGRDSWATDPAVAHLVDQPAEATYVRRGCLAPVTALEAAAGDRERGRVLRRQDADDLEPLDALALALGDHLATAWTGADRTDLFDRLRIADDPLLDAPGGFADAFRHGVADPTSGRIGWDVRRPALAADVVRREALPPALCPTGED